MPDHIIDPTPCDPNATPETRALMKYLTSVYGKYVISGQQEIYGNGNDAIMNLNSIIFMRRQANILQSEALIS